MINFLEFQKKMAVFGVFSVDDIAKMFPGFSWLNLVNWQKKGYLLKIRQKWYCFTDLKDDENIVWLAANLIYKPSYISLETALSYYGLLPEAYYVISSISPLKTNSFETPLGTFTYNTVKPELFGFGHSLISSSVHGGIQRQILLAEPEKAILDYFYIRKQYNTLEDIKHLRFDTDMLAEQINQEKLLAYLNRFQNKVLETRVENLLRLTHIF